MFIWVATVAAAGLAVISARMVSHAFGSSLGPGPRRMSVEQQLPTITWQRTDQLGKNHARMLLVEIAFSFGMATMILGLSFAASMPVHLMAGALIAQGAVVGSLFAPPMAVNVGNLSMRPAAIALGVAQLAQVIFFIRAMGYLIS